MMLGVLSKSVAHIATLAQRKCGYKRPRRRIEASPIVLPNVRSKECSIHQTSNGAYALVPSKRLNPSLHKEPIRLYGDPDQGAVYMRYWRMSLRPFGGPRLREVDVRIERKK